ncbi:DUF2079 domain-containing protein [Candidatus Woesebacteria bacterium]|nr:DUF2079 domain-containing protein [Candidatus Woesebacteria bacterium]
MKNRLTDILSYGWIMLYTIAACLVSLHRFWQFEVFYYDFGIFDQAIWNVAHFRAPIIDHFVIGGKIIFADHFSPSMFLLSPLYWITNKPEVLLIAQALAVGASALVLYRLAKHTLHHAVAAFAITMAYLLFVGTQNALIADIHEVTFMALPLMLALYAIITKQLTLFWISFFVTLGFKESSALLGIALSVYMYLYNKKWLHTAIVVGAISLIWGYLTTQLIIPYFYGERYFYTPTFDPNPFKTLWTLVDDPIKRKTIITSLLSFGFLPLFSPFTWPLLLQDFASRFMQNNFALRWGLGLHYSILLAVIMAFSSINTLVQVKKRTNPMTLDVIAVALILITVFLHQFKLHGPLGLAYNPAFYANTRNFSFLNDLISRVPPNTTVMTQNNIAPHMIHTHKVFLLRDIYEDFMPDYFVLDLRDGQNGNNFFGVKIDALMARLSNDARYHVAYKTNEQVIYKRN